MGQKGTIGIKLRQADMPFTKEGITPDLIVSPCAFPKRMTIAQFIECIFGKVCAIKGVEGNGTPFTNPDTDSIRDELEKLGYNRDGTEYMYNGMTGKKILTSVFIGPTYYQRLKHLVSDKIHCLTADHEVLTTNGWITIDKITVDHNVACLENNKLVYNKPIEIHKYDDYDGKMYKIKNQQIDLNVTLNHRMYVSCNFGRQRIKLDYELIEANEIVGKNIRYKKNAEWNKPNYQFILPAIEKYNEKIFDMTSWLLFFGIWIAEGWTQSRKDGRWPNSYSYLVTIAQNKQRVKNVLYDCIEKLGYNYNIQNEKFNIANKQLYKYLKDYSVGAPNKFLPKWVWELSAEQCKILINGMLLGDGTINKNTGCEMYYTSSQKLANDFMRLCLHAGWACNISINVKAGSVTCIKGRPITSNYDILRCAIIKTRCEPQVNHSHVNKQNIQEEEIYDYKGSVYCLSVPSQVFYVRRNGKPIWTGNSRARGPKTRLTRQPPEGRSRDGGLRVGEMERDAIIAHGLAFFLKERLMDVSDIYWVYICGMCGLFAQRMLRKNSKNRLSVNDVYHCPSCNNKTNISKVRIPYAFKLMLQELMAMSIAPRIRVKEIN